VQWLLSDLLEPLVQETRRAVEERRRTTLPDRTGEILSLRGAIELTAPAIIAELKPRSPREGDLLGTREILALAAAYEAGGAAAISVLTSPSFGGAVETLARVKRSVDIPVLSKDFVLDEFQVREAFGYGADAVLLIAALSPVEKLLDVVDDLGLDAVVECHSAEEIERAANAGADLIGINNRDLRTFSVDLETTARLAAGVPRYAKLISESGVRGPEDARYLFECGADALLIGTAVMKAANPQEFIQQCRQCV
jgi:indole-3-glycerol phosphate synthase